MTRAVTSAPSHAREAGGHPEERAPERPLIVTLRPDPAAFARFDALRRRHFPSARNLVPAHVTLFHHLPGAERRHIERSLADLAATMPPILIEVEGVRFLGRGVAFALASDELVRLRARLARDWDGWLTPQDRQPYRPHVTIQNKAEPAAARSLYEELRAGFAPCPFAGEGLDLWHYAGGPWLQAGVFAFGGSSPPAGAAPPGSS